MATLSDHLFLLNHIMRCPAGIARWATSYLQILPPHLVHQQASVPHPTGQLAIPLPHGWYAHLCPSALASLFEAASRGCIIVMALGRTLATLNVEGLLNILVTRSHMLVHSLDKMAIDGTCSTNHLWALLQPIGQSIICLLMYNSLSM